jgi:hypothetical protein
MAPWHYCNSLWHEQITIGTKDQEPREFSGEAGGLGDREHVTRDVVALFSGLFSDSASGSERLRQ